MVRVKASHILVKDEKAANKLIEKLKKGEDFARLAKVHSSCPSGKKGGDLGFFSKGQMAKQFENAAFSQEIDEISKPVRTQFGYHIIKVTAKK